MVGLLKSHRVRMFSMSVFAIVLPSIVLCSIQEGINSRACIFSNIFIQFSSRKERLGKSIFNSYQIARVKILSIHLDMETVLLLAFPLNFAT